MELTDKTSSDDSPSTVRRMTGQQPAAIAVFELQGKRALEVAAGHLQLRNHLSVWELPLQKIAFGHWQHAARTDTPNPAALHEDVVFCRTDHDVAELHTHGSPAVAESVFAAFRDHGVAVVEEAFAGPTNQALVPRSLPEILRYLEPEWWETDGGSVSSERWQRAVESLTAGGWDKAEESLCRIQSLAFSHLGRAHASEVGLLLWAQLRGAMVLRLESIAHMMIQRSSSALSNLDELLATWSYGQFLSREIQVLVTGAPNVGKSSLINALLGYQRSVVSDTPGTTRDLVGQTTAIAGWQFRLIDSAGVRRSDNELEEHGIRRAAEAALSADLIISVNSVDQTAASISLPIPQTPTISILNKIDLVDSKDIRSGSTRAEQEGRLAVSTKTGQGLSELMSAMVRAVLSEPTRNPSTDSKGRPAVVFAPEILECLREWRSRLVRWQSSESRSPITPGPAEGR